MLRPLATDLWVAEAPLSVFGAEIGARMTVVRLDDGTLWLHSPIAPDAALKAEIDALGPVSCLVAPNLYHHLYLEAAQRAWPDARTYAPPALGLKRPDLRIDEVLGGKAPQAWRHQIDQVPLQGAPKLGETLFFHRASKTLLIADLAFHMVSHPSWWTRALLGWLGVMGRLATSRNTRRLFEDPAALHLGTDRVLGWDFDRVILCHGEIIETGGRERVAELFAQL